MTSQQLSINHMTLSIADIKKIAKNSSGKGYLIEFNDGRTIVLHKRRTLPALLTLIKHGEGCENDLTKLTTNLEDLITELGPRCPEGLIQESYSDANKPFSELWNEEGFVFIHAASGEKRKGSQKYILRPTDHDKLFTVTKKAERQPPSVDEQDRLLKHQENRCNFCGSHVKKDVPQHTFSRDRVRLVWDHRIPVEKNGKSAEGNYQGLCFYCNKSKWQICNICTDDGSSCTKCALAFPEKTTKIFATEEDISDRLPYQG